MPIQDPPPVVLDATLRDGGYYTNWNFPRGVVERMAIALCDAGVDWIELGYRAPDAERNCGLYRYCTEHYLDFLPQRDGTRYAFMIDIKDFLSNGEINSEFLESLIPCSTKSLFSMCRVASHAIHVKSIPPVVEWIKDRGYLVGVNLMGSSLLSKDEFSRCADTISSAEPDVFYFADSFGSMMPATVSSYVKLIRDAYDGPMGIHTHDNQGLAFANSLQAIRDGVQYIDGTLTGMGRGPGNLQLEQLLLWLAHNYPDREYQPNELLGCIEDFFIPKKEEYGWGFNYVYMLSGLKDIHPSYCQKLTEGNKFNFRQVTGILESIDTTTRHLYRHDELSEAINRSSAENVSYQPLVEFGLPPRLENDECLVVARGEGRARDTAEANQTGVSELACAVQDYLRHHPVHVFECNHTFILDQYSDRTVCVLNRMRLQEICQRSQIDGASIITGEGFIPKLHEGVDVKHYPFELGSVSACKRPLRIPDYEAGQYAVALAVAVGYRRLKLAGFSGYDDPERNERMSHFFIDLQGIVPELDITFVTPTKYQGLKQCSIYSY